MRVIEPSLMFPLVMILSIDFLTVWLILWTWAWSSVLSLNVVMSCADVGNNWYFLYSDWNELRSHPAMTCLCLYFYFNVNRFKKDFRYSFCFALTSGLEVRWTAKNKKWSDYTIKILLTDSSSGFSIFSFTS